MVEPTSHSWRWGEETKLFDLCQLVIQVLLWCLDRNISMYNTLGNIWISADNLVYPDKTLALCWIELISILGDMIQMGQIKYTSLYHQTERTSASPFFTSGCSGLIFNKLEQYDSIYLFQLGGIGRLVNKLEQYDSVYLFPFG